MSRDDQSHFPLLDAQRRSLREDRGGGLVVGYDSGPNGPRAVPGDEKFPYVMVPPDLGQLTKYISGGLPDIHNLTITDAAAFQVGGVIDVRGLRQLTMFVTLVIPHPQVETTNNALILVPQVSTEEFIDNSDGIARDSYDKWFTIGVVNPQLLGAFPTATDTMQAIGAPTYAIRNVHETQLNIPYAPTNLTLGTTFVQTTLVFDVAPYELFLLRYARAFIAGLTSVVYPNSGYVTDATARFSVYLQGQR